MSETRNSSREFLFNTHMNKMGFMTSAWWKLFWAILCLKGLILAVDHTPMFFMGDSGTYIITALSGWIPPDRSFAYGFLIKLITWPWRNLTWFISFQIVLSSATCWMCARLLSRYFECRFKVCVLSGILLAVFPLQLLYERYLLTETVAGFLFVIYLSLLLEYIAAPKFYKIGVLALVGVLLVSIRISFLPCVFALAACVPVLGWWNDWKVKTNNVESLPFSPRRMQKLIVSIAISLGSFVLVQGTYQRINGLLSHRAPAYSYADGFFLLCNFSPLCKPDYYPDYKNRDKVFSTLKYDLKDRRMSDPHRWGEGGLVSNIVKNSPDLDEANRRAKETAIQIVKNNPAGIVRLSWERFLDYFDIQLLKEAMKGDKQNIPLPGYMVQILRENYNYQIMHPEELKTLSNQWYFGLFWWPLVLLFTPFFILGVGLFIKKPLYPSLLAVLLCAVFIESVAIVLSNGPIVRYLHPLEYLLLISMALLINRTPFGREKNGISCST